MPAPAAASELDPTFTFPGASPADTSLTLAVPLPNGQVLIGGTFTNAGPQLRNRLARLNADGTPDLSFNALLAGATFPFVRAILVLPDGKILVGGRFDSVAGTARSNLARLHPDGSLDTSFDVAVSGFVNCLVMQADGKLLIGGEFSTVAGTGRAHLARLNTDNSLDTGFDASVGIGYVRALAVQPDGRILVAGNYFNIRGVGQKHIARLNADSTLDTAFNPNITVPSNPTVQALAVQADGKILIGSSTAITIDGVVRNALTRLDSNGDVDTAYNPSPLASSGATRIECIVLQADGKAIISGAFNTVSGQTRGDIARINPDGTLDPDLIANNNGPTTSVALQDDGRVLMAGTLLTVNGTPVKEVVRLLNGRASRSLVVPDLSTVRWLRGGTAPEVRQVTFDLSTDGGSNWSPLGAGTRFAGGWELTGQTLPASGQVRARGITSAGYYSGSGTVVERVAAYPDTSTQAPSLGAFTNTGAQQVQLSFTLPEDALPGSVRLEFFNDTPSSPVLIVAEAEEGEGMHTITFDPANPAASPGIASGPAVPDGPYLLTLSYRDATGNSLASSMNLGIAVDTTTLPPVLASPAANATVGTSIGVNFTLPEAALAGSLTLTFHDGTTPRVLTLASAVQGAGAHSFSFDPAAPVLAPQVASGPAIPDGTYTVTLSYRDTTGNLASTDVSTGVRVLTVPPEPEVVIGSNTTATGAGLPSGSTFASFTAPDVGVYGGKVATPTGQRLDAVFTDSGTVLLRGQQSVEVAPGGGEMGMIAKLAPPTGDAVLATLDRRSGATAADDQVLFVGLQDSDPEPLVRKGQEIPGLPGVRLKSFLTLDGNGATTFFSGKLTGDGVNGSNSTAIFAASPAAGFKMLVRKGQMVDGKQVKIIATLVGAAGTLAEGRWRSGPDDLGMRLTFTDKSQALYLVPVTATGPQDWLLLGKTGGGAGTDLPGALLKSFMLPAHAPGATVFESLLQVGPGSITPRNSRAVFDAEGVETRGPISLRLLGQTAGPAPAQTNIQRFLNTLAGLNRASTVIAHSSLPGQRASRPTIYDARADGVLAPIARVGDPAPGGGRWQRFVSVAKPDGQGYGALISALLAVSAPEGVTASNKAALYARDSSGELRRILRAGDQIESAGPGSPMKPVTRFAALGAAPGSIGAARGYDDSGRVSVLVTFADRTQAVVRIQVP